VLNDGPHKWQVTATNLGGGQTFSRTATIFVDTVPPRVSFTLKGRDRVGRKLTMHVSFADLPPPQQPGAKASGVKSVLIRWGDGSKSTHVHVASHVYARRGRYLIKVTVTDRAGNATTVARVVRIRK
jgi:PKD repeat protein